MSRACALSRLRHVCIPVSIRLWLGCSGLQEFRGNLMFAKFVAMEHRGASIALVISFVLYSVLYQRAMLIGRDGYVWETPARNLPFEHMFMVVFFVHGLFLLLAARDPIRNLSLIDYSIVSGTLHGFVMYWDASRLGLADHLRPSGDVLATFFVPILLTLTHPRRFYLGDLFSRS